jgi:hypothetical protein
MKKGLHIALTITGCKRPELFKSTVDSLCSKIKDLHLIKTIIHYDDSSDDESRKKMYEVLVSNFPDKLVCTRYFNKDSFTTDKRHMHVMNCWLDDLSQLGIDYVFHTEDDWLYTNDLSISGALDILISDDKCGQIGFSQPLRRFPEGIHIEKGGDYWKWYYREDLPLLDNLFMDDLMIEQWNVPGLWLYYINWPHFSLRPGLFDVEKLLTVGKFLETEESFEFEFAKKYSKKFYNYSHKLSLCEHIGDSNSSYELNNSKR